MLNTINNRLLLAFGIFTINVVIASSISYYYLKQANDYKKLDQVIQNAHVNYLKLNKGDMAFFQLDKRAPSFFMEGKCEDTRAHQVKKARLDSLITQLMNNPLSRDPVIAGSLETIDSLLAIYDTSFGITLNKIRERGFEDFGMEGKMRSYVHELEGLTGQLDLSDVLSLRRHEKDYFLRKEPTYINQLNSLSKEMLNNLNPRAPGYRQAYDRVNQYTESFNRVVSLEAEIGMDGRNGLKQKLAHLDEQLNQQFNQLYAYSSLHSEQISRKSEITFLLTVIVSVILSVVLSLTVSRNLSRPITELAESMDRFIANGFRGRTSVQHNTSVLELKVLSQSFENLIRRTREQFKEIKQKSHLLKKQNRDLTKLNEELDQFVYSAAHDLRAPLTSVLGLVSILRMEEHNKQSRNEYLDMIEKTVAKLDSFISDIVNYSKNNRLQVNHDPINFKSLIQGVINDHLYCKEAIGVDRKIEVSGNYAFFTDKRRLTVILNNLISNAFRYQDGKKTGRFVSVKVNLDQEACTLVVSDNGMGIPVEHQQKIFDMFYRATATSNGSGLGLFIVKENVEKLGGDIQVSSTPHQGTSFTIRIPNLKPAEKLNA